jgi:hypothetical protein
MLAPGVLSDRQLPHWAVFYSLSVFWLVWSPTEEVIYRAYCAARLQVLTGSTWVTITLVGFWWAFQHSVFPLVFDWRLIVFRFLQFPALGRNLPAHLSADASSSADDHDALANGLVRCCADAPPVTRLRVSELMLLALEDAS